MHTAPKLGPVDFRRSFGGTIATYRPSTTCYGGRCLVREPGGVALGQATDWLRGRGLSAVSRRGRCRRYIRHGLPWREPTTASFAAGYAKERAQTSGRAAQRRSRPPTYCPNSSWQPPLLRSRNSLWMVAASKPSRARLLTTVRVKARPITRCRGSGFVRVGQSRGKPDRGDGSPCWDASHAHSGMRMIVMPECAGRAYSEV